MRQSAVNKKDIAVAWKEEGADAEEIELRMLRLNPNWATESEDAAQLMSFWRDYSSLDCY